MTSTSAPIRLLLIVSVLAVFATACGSSETTSEPAAVVEAEQPEAGDDASDEAEETTSETAVAVEASDEPSQDTDDDTDDAAKADKTPAEPEAEPEPEPTSGSGNLLAKPGERTNWTVQIGEARGTMWLAQHGEFVRGEITYERGDGSITLAGRQYASGDGYFIHEFGLDGSVYGTITLTEVDDYSIGESTWLGDGAAPPPAVFEFESAESDPDAFEPAIRPGIYEWAFGPFPGDEQCCGAVGTLTIEGVGDGTAVIDVQANRGAPSYNLAAVYSTELPRTGNVVHYEVSDDYLDCKFDITVFDGVAFVTTVDDRFECGFGNGAHVEGIYVQTTLFVAAEDSPFATSELSATSFGPVEIGQTWAELVELGAEPYDPERDDFGGCHYTTFAHDPHAPWIMLLGEGADATVARIELQHVNSATVDGVRLGDTEADVRAAVDIYEERPHEYLGEGAKYLTVRPADGAESTMLVVTDEQGEVIGVRNGLLNPIRWVEGCA